MSNNDPSCKDKIGWFWKVLRFKRPPSWFGRVFIRLWPFGWFACLSSDDLFGSSLVDLLVDVVVKQRSVSFLLLLPKWLHCFVLRKDDFTKYYILILYINLQHIWYSSSYGSGDNDGGWIAFDTMQCVSFVWYIQCLQYRSQIWDFFYHIF